MFLWHQILIITILRPETALIRPAHSRGVSAGGWGAEVPGWVHPAPWTLPQCSAPASLPGLGEVLIHWLSLDRHGLGLASLRWVSRCVIGAVLSICENCCSVERCWVLSIVEPCWALLCVLYAMALVSLSLVTSCATCPRVTSHWPEPGPLTVKLWSHFRAQAIIFTS